MNKKKPILIVAGEPFGIFSEILFKTIKQYKMNKPIVVIGSYELIKVQMSYLKYKIPLNAIPQNFKTKNLKMNTINLIDIKLNFNKPFQKISAISPFCLQLSKKTFFPLLSLSDSRSLEISHFFQALSLAKNNKSCLF